MQQYAKQQGDKKVPYVIDNNSVMAAFGAKRTPEVFLLDAWEQLVYHGAIDDKQDASRVGTEYLSSALIEAASGKQVSHNKTWSVGCAIQRKA